MVRASREIEIKFKVTDVKKLERELRRAGFRLVTPRTHEMNVLFDLPDGSLRRSGQVFRIRRYGKEWLLTHKGRGTDQRHKVRHETEVRLKDGHRLEAMLRAMGMKESFRYEKFRSEWKDKTGKVVVDVTPIGDFAEIEGPARWIDRIAKRLGVAPNEYITDSYVVLFAKWRRRARSASIEMTFKATRKRRA